RHRAIDGQFKGSEEAIAMAVMYTANHLKVRAIVALTESGATPLWMSRIRADIPVYAFTRHEATRRRVTLYRGVYPVIFDVTAGGGSTGHPDRALFTRLLQVQLGKGRRLGRLTNGGHSRGQGGTHSLQNLTVGLDAAHVRLTPLPHAHAEAHRRGRRGADAGSARQRLRSAACLAAAPRWPCPPCWAQRPGSHCTRCAWSPDHRGCRSARPRVRHRIRSRAGP